MTRVVVLSTVRLFGEALATCLEAKEQISQVLYCHSNNYILKDVVAFEPDVILFDITGENVLNGAYAFNTAVPETPLLAIAIPETPDQVIACADAGFWGYVPRKTSITELCETVAMAIKGECACHPKIAYSLLRELGRRRERSSDSASIEHLTRRECEILRFLARGSSNKEIASELCLSPATIKNHVHNIFVKLNVGCRTEAVSRVRDEPWLANAV